MSILGGQKRTCKKNYVIKSFTYAETSDSTGVRYPIAVTSARFRSVSSATEPCGIFVYQMNISSKSHDFCTSIPPDFDNVAIGMIFVLHLRVNNS